MQRLGERRRRNASDDIQSLGHELDQLRHRYRQLRRINADWVIQSGVVDEADRLARMIGRIAMLGLPDLLIHHNAVAWLLLEGDEGASMLRRNGRLSLSARNFGGWCAASVATDVHEI